MQQGIIYQKTGQRDRGVVQNYHNKPNPLKLNKTLYSVDVSGLKSAQQKQVLKISDGAYESNFTIGMEVEKNQLSRGAVKEYELFCGFERDGSCGYEAVTHVLPLLPSGKWRTKVFDMMFKAERIIDDKYSPSDNRCGGHISVGVDGMRGDELLYRMRGNCGIVLALFRHRLNNTYCGSNRRMVDNDDHCYDDIESYSGSGSYSSHSIHHKYQLALAKSNYVEFRLPSRFESVKQMMRRYELFYEIVNFTINNPTANHEVLLKRVEPIVLSMYSGDEVKCKSIIEMSRHFRKFILDGVKHESIADFLK